MRWIVVELDTGEQNFFDSAYDGFRFAKEAENKRRHSVEYVFISDSPQAESYIVYRGQELRWMLRMLDNVTNWIRIERGGANDLSSVDTE